MSMTAKNPRMFDSSRYYTSGIFRNINIIKAGWYNRDFYRSHYLVELEAELDAGRLREMINSATAYYDEYRCISGN